MGNQGRFPNEPDTITKLSGRIYGFAATEDDLAAVGVPQREAGMLAWVTDTLTFWWFDDEATDPASPGSIVVPTSGTGRWKLFPAGDVTITGLPLTLGGAPGARIIGINAAVAGTANYVPIRGVAGELTSAWFQTGATGRPTVGDLRVASGSVAVASLTTGGGDNIGLQDDGADGWNIGSSVRTANVNIRLKNGGAEFLTINGQLLQTRSASGITFGPTASAGLRHTAPASPGAGNAMSIGAQNANGAFAGGTINLFTGTGTTPGGVNLELNDDGAASGILTFKAGGFGAFLTVRYDDAGGQVQLDTSRGLNLDAANLLSFNSDVSVDLQYAGTSRLKADAAGLGFYGHATAAQPSDVAAITDNSGGSAGAAIATTGDATTDDNFATVVQRINSLRAALRAIGLMA